MIVARKADAPPPAKIVNRIILETAPIKKENVAGKKEKKAMTLWPRW